MSVTPTTRLAPSPTGALHLGNARTFLVNWLLARQHGWRIVLRIEDIDGPRIKQGADRQLLEDLAWLGLDWDIGPIRQTTRTENYRRAIEKLTSSHSAYPCVCTRREVELSASAPHAEDGSTRYTGACRGRFTSVGEAIAQVGRAPAIRFAAPNEVISFEDGFHGTTHLNASAESGDFVVCKADRTPAYQLAVVVDDAEMGVTQVVRGDDLLTSTPRQILLYHALGWAERVPRYTHLPLVVGDDGKRLAKRHGDTRLSTYRDAGVSPERVRLLLGRWCGIDATLGVDTTVDLLTAFRFDQLPRQRIVFTHNDDAWLRG